VRGSIRAWLPATAVAALLAVALGAAAYFSFVRGSGGFGPSPSPSADIHSKEAVIAAVKHYYDVEAQARKTGNADLIDPVTIGHASLASQNFRAYVAEQAAQGKRSVVVHNYFADWHVAIDRDKATATYSFWLAGHDTDLSGKAIEPDNTTSRGLYRMRLQLTRGIWLVAERDLLQDNVR
jgi:hypothetical protein